MRAGIGISLSCLSLLSLPQTQITDGVKFEEAASPHLRSSMTLTMISNGDKCGVKGLQAHGFLSHSIKDGIKCRLSLMCHSCRKTRWRTRDETSFRGKCDGEMCFRCPDTDPHHDLEFWFSTCLKREKRPWGGFGLNWSLNWVVLRGEQDQGDVMQAEPWPQPSLKMPSRASTGGVIWDEVVVLFCFWFLNQANCTVTSIGCITEG